MGVYPLISDFLKKVGLLLFADDYRDMGNMDRIHHWQWGFLLMQLGIMLRKVEMGENTWGDLLAFLIRNGFLFASIYEGSKKEK